MLPPPVEEVLVELPPLELPVPPELLRLVGCPQLPPELLPLEPEVLPPSWLLELELALELRVPPLDDPLPIELSLLEPVAELPEE